MHLFSCDLRVYIGYTYGTEPRAGVSGAIRARTRAFRALGKLGFLSAKEDPEFFISFSNFFSSLKMTVAAVCSGKCIIIFSEKKVTQLL